MSAFQEEVIEGTSNVLSRSLKWIWNLFVSHPKEQGMTYSEHWRHACRLSYRMWYGSVCLLVHAFFPFACQTKGTRIIKALYIESKNTNRLQEGVKEV